MSEELHTIIDHIRYGASRFNAAALTFGHGYDNALDEATQLVLHALHLPHDLSPVYGQARLTRAERKAVLDLFDRRVQERRPACYLTGSAWFAGLQFKCDQRALVPRSPIAELIEAGFEPWLGELTPQRVLDLCTGGGSIAIAIAHHLPRVMVDAVDISPAALALARENALDLQVAEQVRFLESDLFSALAGESYDLIVSNPPYVSRDEFQALPPEYAYEPANGLVAGEEQHGPGQILGRAEAAGAADALKKAGAQRVWLAGKHEGPGIDTNIFTGADVVHLLKLAQTELGVAQ